MPPLFQSLNSLKASYQSNDLLLPEENVYTSIDDVPVEDDLVLDIGDGDNSLLQAFPDGLPQERMLSGTQLLTVSQVVVLPRTLRYRTPYMRGKDVFALQRALSKAGHRKWGTFTYAFGTGTRDQVKAFQRRVGLSADGVYGPETHAKLARYYDAWGAYLMAQQRQKMALTPRDKIKNAAVFGYNKRAYIYYTQSSLRMYGVKNKLRPPSIPKWEDCSSFATWCYYVAGLPDPNRLGYNGYGYTGTLSANGRRTTTPQVGDLAFYGYFPHGHVTIYIGNGKCISHGNHAGPSLLSVYYRPVNVFKTYL